MFGEGKPHLLPLPLEPFRYYQYGERAVHLDGCAEVDPCRIQDPDRKGKVESCSARESFFVAGVAILAGVPLAIGGSRQMRSMLFGVQPGDMISFLLALFGVILVALAASIIPARRAAALDPIVALRYESGLMSFLRDIAGGLRSLFRREQMGRELDEELRAYREMAAEEKMKDEMSRKEAFVPSAWSVEASKSARKLARLRAVEGVASAGVLGDRRPNGIRRYCRGRRLHYFRVARHLKMIYMLLFAVSSY